MYSFIPPFYEAKFCGVPSRVFDKLGCAAGEESLWNSDSEQKTSTTNQLSIIYCCGAA
jgi:hypothetical protein